MHIRKRIERVEKYIVISFSFIFQFNSEYPPNFLELGCKGEIDAFERIHESKKGKFPVISAEVHFPSTFAS